MVELELEEVLIESFGSLVFDRLKDAGVTEDRFPSLISIISHIEECLDKTKFGTWVTGLIALESKELEEDSNLSVVSIAPRKNNE